ncbi:hypothetical protein E3G61_002840 [Mycobacteroides abscessus]|nr:hypothetical protein [Mycobacteroides abscessus]QOF28454.1 hypothetical protein E3G43_002005 [Mycobacteroides abscessus]
MLSSLIRLIPPTHRGPLYAYCVLSVVSVAIRAASCLLLVPLLGALFGTAPADALPWLGVLTAVTVGGWMVDTALARLGYSIGFALLNDSQHQVADRLTHIPLGWFSAERTALARQAISSGGPELVGFIANLLTPLIGAALLPAALTAGLFFISWKLGVAAAITLPLLLGALLAGIRIVRSADEADTRAHSALTERILEFARTQAALRASRRVAPARSQTGQAVAAARGTTMRLLLFQIPGQLIFSVVSQIALILLVGTITMLAVRGEIGAPQAVALMVVVVRFLEPFTVLADLAGAVENSRAVFERLNTIITAEAADQPAPAPPPPKPRPPYPIPRCDLPLSRRGRTRTQGHQLHPRTGHHHRHHRSVWLWEEHHLVAHRRPAGTGEWPNTDRRNRYRRSGPGHPSRTGQHDLPTSLPLRRPDS